MNQTVYVGNLPASGTADDLQEMFSRYGTVDGVKLPAHPSQFLSGHMGIAFVELEDGAETAIEELNGTEYHGGLLVVNKAQTPADRVSNPLSSLNRRYKNTSKTSPEFRQYLRELHDLAKTGNRDAAFQGVQLKSWWII